MSEENRKKHIASAAAALLTAAVWIVLSLRWDFYFDLNDDVLMKDILSGSYTGVPEALNIQMLAPLSWLISLMYRLFRDIDWYGTFLLLMQALSFFLVVRTAICLGMEKHDGAVPADATARVAIEGRREREFRIFSGIAAGASAALCFATLMLYHEVFVQYTLTVAMMGGAAAFLFLGMKMPQAGDPRYFCRLLRACLPSFGLIWAGYLLRSEMMLLILPLVLTAALFRVLEERTEDRALRRRAAGSVALSVLVLLAGLALAYGADDAAYSSSAQWKEFRSWFDARTELYDFAAIPSYGENSAFYDSIGVDSETVALLQDYNFALDDTMDSQTLRKIADYADGLKASEKTNVQRLKEALWNYRKSMFGSDDEPYNVMAAAGYVLLLLMTLTGAFNGFGLESGRKEGNGHGRRTVLFTLLRLFFFFCVRTALWLYILYRGRSPVRITHSLYLVECLVLLGLILRSGRRSQEYRVMSVTAQFMLFSIAAAFLPGQIRTVCEESLRRVEVNAPYEKYVEYCAAHPDSYYLTDVYSTVDFSEKMFVRYPEGTSDNAAANRDILGGWADRSPLYAKKLAAYGYTGAREALTGGKNCFLVAAEGSDTAFLTDYCAARGEKVKVQESDRIGSDFTVYRVVKAGAQ
ncbi:MAG: hypothetical protein LKJ76_02550 [Lachnospiraceae bacterium]|nr:hypothetical protein [Lachnospiraceae bacterium]